MGPFMTGRRLALAALLVAALTAPGRAGSDRGQTRVRPGSDRGQTGDRPGSDRGQTGVRPGADPAVGRAEDGSRLWLRYDPIADAARRAAVRAAVTAIVITPGSSPTLRASADELQKAASTMVGAQIPLAEKTVPT